MSSTVFPAEWAPQSGIMITWPHPHSDWRESLPDVEPVYVQLTRHISRHEKVLINCRDATLTEHVELFLREDNVDLQRVILRIVPTNDTWTRDYGPLTVLEQGRPRLLDFTFNGWGGKFAAPLDDQATRRLHEEHVFGDTPLTTVDMVLEGGSIDSDGLGTLLTTEDCLLAATRNPTLSRAQIEERLCRWFGAQRILWLRHGHLIGDDTDSHIDTLARFCDPHTIAYVACDDREDEHYGDLKGMEAELHSLRDANGNPYRLVALPWPGAKYDSDGRRLAASYANFLIINDAVLVPTYDDPADSETLRRLQDCFPGREIIGIPCLPLIRQNGSLHCITMQLPVGVI